jgi:bacterioferritin
MKDWGFETLAAKEHEESIDEMKHADELMDRILFLEGLPILQELGKRRIGEDVPEMLQCDLDLELDAIPICAQASPTANHIRTTSLAICLTGFCGPRKSTWITWRRNST